ncbi:hypothetical protein G7Y89_g859 [Cudoniella acicularis]|uniref:Uncharacterized protein n=1 Tax=Cudoniella acicularis TaxID=354080 RepID=A0A8H4W8H8_9HELO|nr:hypothetical protein G7Y89_g859 [Cudoniella acicularis]
MSLAAKSGSENKLDSDSTYDSDNSLDIDPNPTTSSIRRRQRRQDINIENEDITSLTLNIEHLISKSKSVNMRHSNLDTPSNAQSTSTSIIKRNRNAMLQNRFYLAMAITNHKFAFSTLDGQNISVPIPLSFGGKEVARVHYPLLVWEKKTSRMAYAFIDETWMRSEGRKCFPARTLNGKRKGRAEPREVQVIDPYFVALIIAMTQGCTQAGQESRHINLFTISPNRKSLLYSAEVTIEFLNKFAYPYLRSVARLAINQQSIPLNPPKKLLQIIRGIVETKAPVDQKKEDIQQENSANFDNYKKNTKIDPSDH